MKMILSTQQTMSSVEISNLVGVRHDNVKRTIRSLLADKIISQPQFEDGKKAANGVVVVNYLLTKRDSLVVVAQLSPEFTGAIVDRWQELENKEQLKIQDKQIRAELRVEYRPMTDAIVDSREGQAVKFYHFTTEADLINRIVFGCSSAKFKVAHDIEKNEALRDFLTIEQKNALISLQKANTVLLLMGMEYDERKTHLTKLYDKQHSKKLIEEHMRLGA